MLIVAVILLIAGIMFAARFIILIFLMILSPLALIAYIIPGQMGKFNEWKDALIAQSFFAPIYFALTWVVFKLGTSLLKVLSAPTGGVAQTKDMTDVFSAPSSAMALIVNYVLIIGFSIAALIFAKTMASKTAGFKAISGGIGTATMGGVALAGRNTIGRASSLISETQREKWSKSAGGRAGLWLANKGSKASFDTRGLAETKLGKATGASDVMGIAGKFSGKGGFRQAVEDKAKEKAKYAKEVYGQTGAEKERASNLENEYKNKDAEYEASKKTDETRIRAERTSSTAKAKTEMERAKKEFETKSTSTLEYSGKKEDIEAARVKMEATQKAHASALEKEKSKIEEVDYNESVKAIKTEADARKQAWEKVKNAGTERQREYAKRVEGNSPISTSGGAVIGGAIGSFIPIPVVGTVVGAAVGGYIGKKVGEKIPVNHQGNKAAARVIRDQVREKSKAEKAADSAREYQKELDEKEKASGTAPSETASTPKPASAAEHHAETAPLVTPPNS
jgi:uncharacterized protein YcfJ